jgi:uncharacterized protein DUF4238
MARWEFPPPEVEVDYYAAIRELEADKVRPVRGQHVVSKVVLKGFASKPARQRGWQLARFDKRLLRELDPKGLDACGKVKDFISYASGSVEALWHSVETKLADVILAAENGRLHADVKNVDVMKDAIALHLVRSSHYRRVHVDGAMASMKMVRREALANKRDLLVSAFRDRLGQEPTSVEDLENILDENLEHWRELMREGALFRVSIERMFHRVRLGLRELGVQVLRVTPGKEFIISDSPAFTFSYEAGGAMALRMAIGDSHGIALPLTRSCLVAIGPDSKDEVVAPGLVDQLNRIQLRLAERQVYYAPGSQVANWVRSNIV